VATLVRFGPSGERRAERSVSVDVDWLVAVDDETLVVGSAAGNGEGFDADLDRRFALSVPTPSDRPSAGRRSGRRGWRARRERPYATDLPPSGRSGQGARHRRRRRSRGSGPTCRLTGRPAVDADGLYAVRSRAVLAVGADGEDRWRAPLPESHRRRTVRGRGSRDRRRRRGAVRAPRDAGRAVVAGRVGPTTCRLPAVRGGETGLAGGLTKRRENDARAVCDSRVRPSSSRWRPKRRRVPR